MAFDSMSFVLNYPVYSSNQVNESSATYIPSSYGMLKISFYDGTFLGAESASYVLTKMGIKLVADLTNTDYVCFFYPSFIDGFFKETVQFQANREFLIERIGIEKQVSSVDALNTGYGIPDPVYRNPEHGGLVQEDTPCICVLFSDSCGTKMTTTTVVID